MRNIISTKKPLFWLLLSGISVGGIYFAYNFFSQAFPIVNLDITMDRQQALQKADQLHKQYQWQPKIYHQAASFDVDSLTQYYIELEAGGAQAFTKLIENQDYSPYIWTVRHFTEFDPNQTYIYFKPDGTFYGFDIHLSETMAGSALSEQEAQVIAVRNAQDNGNISLEHYSLVESSQETQPSGRIDHTFVYERTDIKIGTAPLRLTLVVQGDTLSKIKHSVYVPEDFSRRYQEMRSTNTMIATIALFLMTLVYLLGCCGFGFFILLRQKALIWRHALLWALIIALLHCAHAVSSFPLIWMGYDTAFSNSSIISNFIVSLIGQTIAETLALTFIFICAEGLTRLAFGNHIQLWQLWSKTGRQSLQVLGRTIGGYLIVGFDIAFSVGLYFVALRYFGWWSPSEALYDPNVLATYMPWITPLAQSLSAGFMEECLFRAIPLASAALVGSYFNKRKTFIIIAFIAQALIFGAAHANYAAQPAYARMLELIIPSFVFGGIYLYFGLLSSILSHFLFDVIWFSLPIFVSHSPGIWFDKTMIILGSGLPLFIILYTFLRYRSFITLPQFFYNRSWKPATIKEQAPVANKQDIMQHCWLINKNYVLLIFCIIGLSLLIFTTKFTHNGLRLPNKKISLEKSEKLLNEVPLKNPAWKSISTIQADIDIQNQFVWRTNKNHYESLLGSYLVPVVLKTRYVDFTGSVEERAHEYTTMTAQKDDTVLVIQQHNELPESLELPSLTKEQARILVLNILNKKFALDQTMVEEISAISSKKINRLDWTFIFKLSNQIMTMGEQRIELQISGDQITEIKKFIFVPETWQRCFKQEQFILVLIKKVCLLVMFLLIILFSLLFFKKNKNVRFSWSTFKIFFFVTCICMVLEIGISWETALFNFTTTEPYYHQIFLLILKSCMKIIFMSAFVSYLAAAIQPFITLPIKTNCTVTFYTAMSVGIFSAGLFSLIEYLKPLNNPWWPNYYSAASSLPWLQTILTCLFNYLQCTLFIMLTVIIIEQLSSYWKNNRLQTAVLLVSFITVLVGLQNISSIRYWLIAGIAFGIILLCDYILLFRISSSSIVIVTAIISMTRIIPNIFFNAYDGAIIGYCCALVIISFISILWYILLQKTIQKYPH